MKKLGKTRSGDGGEMGGEMGGEGGEKGYAKGGKVKCATGGKVKAYAKGGTVRGMGAAVKGGSFKGCK